MWDIVKIGLEDIQNAFGITDDLYSKYVEGEIKKNPELIPLMNKRHGVFDWRVETPLGGAGTTLNGCVLYSLIRHLDMTNVIETGVSGGYYSAFMLAALKKNSIPLGLTSYEISEEDIVGNLVPEELKWEKRGCINMNIWNLKKGTDSLVGLKSNPMEATLYSHDSLHTMSHMLKELNEFKRCKNDRFFVFIDDEKSDNFWQKCLNTGAFKKPGYNVKYISGAESRLKGHLGGFLKYQKL